jgi:alanine racemase
MTNISQKIFSNKMKVKKENINSILTINVANLIKNYNKLKTINSKVEVAACVKADAYGLGYIKICKILLENGCNNFFVATAEEALSLRKKFKSINIFLLNGVNDQNTCLEMIKKNILIVINNVDQLNIIKKVFIFRKKKIKCAIHIDIAMNRLGFSAEQFKEVYDGIKNYLNIKLIMSHLTSSEIKNSSHNLQQLNYFKKVINDFSFLKNIKYSLSNSNGSFLGKKYCFNMIRAGGYLFGLDLSSKNKSKPVISLKAKIIQINSISAGSGVGYGANYITKKKSVIATLALGYADGLPRNYKGYILYNNKKAPFVGNISMDLSCIDITAIANIKVNDWVEIFGYNVSILDFAKYSKTITYEISSKIGNRVKRVYNYNI